MPSTRADIDQLSHVARARNLRIAVVESLTAGGVAHAVGSGEAASEWFAGGIVAYMTDVKQLLLGMDAGVDPCSADAAEQLASGGLELFAADLCVSTTGVGGPNPEDGHAAGTVYLGWAMEHVRGHLQLQLQGAPDDVLADTVDAAVHLLCARSQDIQQDTHEPMHTT
ncbi:CinA family protein [Microbacterium sp.]|uniref:CinA family protein n=1 Tax=Microbacterium sp. TaxID=51671 RepID=UPI002623305C|nr:nicotinamide-nucleotide amidohydrolase family protein [Microbacterium sp.]